LSKSRRRHSDSQLSPVLGFGVSRKLARSSTFARAEIGGSRVGFGWFERLHAQQQSIASHEMNMACGTVRRGHWAKDSCREGISVKHVDAALLLDHADYMVAHEGTKPLQRSALSGKAFVDLAQQRLHFIGALPASLILS